MAKSKKYEEGDPRKRLHVAVAQSDSNRSLNGYRVTLREGHWECACRAWTTTVPRRECKHIDRVRRALQVFARTDGRNWQVSDPAWMLRAYNITLGQAFATFVLRNIQVPEPTERGLAVLALVPLVEEEGLPTASAWNTITEIINDEATEFAAASTVPASA